MTVQLPVIDVVQVRARDLPAVNVTLHNQAATGVLIVKINGQWREVLEAWGSDDAEAARSHYGEGSEYGDEAYDKLEGTNLWVAARVLVEETSNVLEVEDAMHYWRYAELVDVQVLHSDITTATAKPNGDTLVAYPAAAPAGRP